jgi:hypothetical protein
MGMYDEIWFDAELPDVPSACRRFQTKSLDCCLDRYTVTKAGRLCLTGNVMLDDEPVVGAQGETEDVDLDFHGDIRLLSTEGDGGEYVARFTHGTLEWIRPMDHLARAQFALMRRKRLGG